MALEDRLFLPIALDLFACYCTEIALVPQPPARCQFITGTEPELGVSLTEDVCCEGMAWVRVEAIHPTVVFSGPQEEPFPCYPPRWTLTLELGAVRCMPIGTIDKLVTPAQALAAAKLVMNDATAMRRAIRCCFANMPSMVNRLYKVGTWAPLPSQGGCGGGTLLLDIEVIGCNECGEEYLTVDP